MSNIFIYGSCVSRDSYNLVKERHSLSGYVARQSFISATSKPTALLPGTDMESKFQNRMLMGDINSNALTIMRSKASEIDLLVIDLTDERLGVHKLPDGSCVTRSTELVTSRRLLGLETPPGLIRFGTERHEIFWKRSASIIMRRLSEMNLLSNTLVMNTPWALQTLDSPGFSAKAIQEAKNARFWLSRYAQHCQSLGVAVVTLPEELALATNDHRWGLAPYHYSSDAYKWMVEQWDSRLAEI